MLFSSIFWYISSSFSRIDSCQKPQRFKCLQFLFVLVEKHQKHTPPPPTHKKVTKRQNYTSSPQIILTTGWQVSTQVLEGFMWKWLFLKMNSDCGKLFTSSLQAVIIRKHDSRLMWDAHMAGCLFTQQRWISTLMCPKTRCHSRQFSRLTCDEIKTSSGKKSEHMWWDIFAARGGIICLSPCHDWSLSEKDQRRVNTVIKWLAFVCSCLFAPFVDADVQPRCGATCTKYKKHRNLFH